jgi:predicted AAA+ superfamily ATPase
MSHFNIDNYLRIIVSYHSPTVRSALRKTPVKFSDEIRLTAAVKWYEFSELKRRGCEIYYWKDKNGKEVDFLIRQGQDITAALQVCQDIDTNETRKREISGALAAAAAFGLTEAKILTADREGEEIHKGVRILYEPVWCWLVQ